MTMVATQNFRSVDRLLAAPSSQAAKQIETLGKPAARAFLRYQVSEQNRWYFMTWETIQLGLGALLLLVLLFGAEAKAFVLLLSLLMLLIVGIQHWVMTPEIARLGRVIDFLRESTFSAEHARFWHFHTAYSISEVIKWGLGIVVTIKLLIRRRRRTGDILDEIDAIDNANDRHIYR
jgi:hypothetical protein